MSEDTVPYATKNEVQKAVNDILEKIREQGHQITAILLLFEPLVARLENLEHEVKCLKEPLQ